MDIQVRPEQYSDIKYDTKERFCSYWHQIREILILKPGNVLEIGIGNGFVSRYLRGVGITVTTLDVDTRLKPDIAASVRTIPFGDNSFPVVACYELLEHIPYDEAVAAFSEICRVAAAHVILSLPDVTRYYRVYLHVPKIGEIRELVTLPRIRMPKHRFDGEHHWEMGKAGYPLKRIVADLRDHGLRIERTYRVYETPYHRFFVLRKSALPNAQNRG